MDALRVMADDIFCSNSTFTRKKGRYAFVNLATRSEAKRAIDELSGHEILGRKIRIELASGKPSTSCDKSEGNAHR
jgi:RNA recognition motif-containing protein